MTRIRITTHDIAYAADILVEEYITHVADNRAHGGHVSNFTDWMRAVPTGSTMSRVRRALNHAVRARRDLGWGGATYDQLDNRTDDVIACAKGELASRIRWGTESLIDLMLWARDHVAAESAA